MATQPRGDDKTDIADLYNELNNLRSEVEGNATTADSITLTYLGYKVVMKINHDTGDFEIWVNGTLKVLP